MPNRKNKLRLWLAASLLGVLLAFLWGPGIIHLCHRMGTSAEERQAMTAKYHQLERQKESNAERMQAYHWFHARGWHIDEGDNHESYLAQRRRSWREIFSYWRSR